MKISELKEKTFYCWKHNSIKLLIVNLEPILDYSYSFLSNSICGSLKYNEPFYVIETFGKINSYYVVKIISKNMIGFVYEQGTDPLDDGFEEIK